MQRVSTSDDDLVERLYSLIFNFSLIIMSESVFFRLYFVNQYHFTIFVIRIVYIRIEGIVVL